MSWLRDVATFVLWGTLGVTLAPLYDKVALCRLRGERLQDSSASYYVPKLSAYTVDVLMDRNAVQGHGVQGW
ncbi:hypothetical protein NQZ68_007794 [Dissostichus eleginoides]|nr:hypothetical protein NQZ68_007794 [Dissostichus eleginoides]